CRKTGCAIAALSSDVARADERSRAVMAAQVERFVAKVANAMNRDGDETRARGGDETRAQESDDAATQDRDEKALLAVSAMIGGLLLSRVMTDPKRSDEVLRALRKALAALANEGGGAGPAGRSRKP